MLTTRTSSDDASGGGAGVGGVGVAVDAGGAVVKSRRTSTVPSHRSVQLTWDLQTGTLWKAPRRLSLTQRCPLSSLVFGVSPSHAHVSVSTMKPLLRECLFACKEWVWGRNTTQQRWWPESGFSEGQKEELCGKFFVGSVDLPRPCCSFLSRSACSLSRVFRLPSQQTTTATRERKQSKAEQKRKTE